MNILRNTLLSSAIVVALAFTSVPLASAAEPIQEVKPQAQIFQEVLTVLPAKNITSPEDVKISFSTPTITSKPAPVVEVIPEPVALTAEVTPIAETATPVTDPAPVAQPPTPAAAPVVAPAPVKAAPTSGVGAALVASAYSQLGVAQDCTRMVENALGSIGIITGDIGPSNFFAYGQVVSDPQPGDLMVQGNSHVAIYVGNGMAISGGFNGQNTVLHPVSYIGGSSYVRVG